MLADAGVDSGSLRLVMDSMHEGFGLLAPDFTILELNKEAMRVDGRAREDVIGQSHWIAYPGTEHSEIGRLYKRAMAERVSIALEHRYKWVDGRTSWFETRAFPVERWLPSPYFSGTSPIGISPTRTLPGANDALVRLYRRSKASCGPTVPTGR